MKCKMSLLMLSLSLIAFSQEKKSGINTTSPQETFDVNGTLRVRDLPLSGSGTIYNGNSTKGTVFIGKKTLALDDTGNLGYVSGMPLTRTDSGDLPIDTTWDTDNVVIDSNGDLKKQKKSGFYAYLDNDFTASGISINKIIPDNEVLDYNNEYNVSTGIFSPEESGVYIVEYFVTTSQSGVSSQYGATGSTSDTRAVGGFVDADTNKWIARYNIQASVDPRGFFYKSIVRLVGGKQYCFGIVSASTGGNIKITAQPTGSTGSGNGSFFSIRRIK